MKARHTPGPWAVYPRSNGGHEIVNQTTRQGVGSTIPLPRFNGKNKEESKAESLANARLMAAAPEMYDLLNELLSDYEQDWQGDEPRQLTDFELRLQQTMTDINPTRNAITPDTEPDYNVKSF